MVQHIFPKGFQRVRYYGLQATKTFNKWIEVIKEGIEKIGRVIKGAYQVIKSKNYRERYIEISGHDPMICRYCGSEMELWKVYHPKYGFIYDYLENLVWVGIGRVVSIANVLVENIEDVRGSRCTVRSSTKGIQLSLFPVLT